MPVKQPTAKSIFWQALELEAATDRELFLNEACGTNHDLRARVEKLLAAQLRSDSFLDPPAVGATIDMPAISEKPGTIIDRYKLLEQIGEGGMGLVFVAEQTEPVRRDVALKLIKPGMDTKQVIARFEAERQALAMMDHPNIAKVLDAGTTDSGRPYFVMELVHGMPITKFCNQQKLDTRQRMKLFVTVCRAVQHAHQKGIIHRDLKPSNVLVELHDVIYVPKVIDFGVAKAINQQLTERTLHTNFAQMIGTPLYMSPEQAELSGLDVDTRTDVYSLGVLLYELLTGTTPFDKQTLKEAGYDEIRRIIRENEPPKPSDRISTLQAEVITTVSHQHGSDPRKLSRTLRGELDWIVMKALEKDRTRRYESASAFATDVERYLSDEPVEACPPSTTYKFKKFARRNKATITTASVVVVALIMGIIGTAWQATRANRLLTSERLARSQLIESKTREAQHATQVSDAIKAALAQSKRLQQQAMWPEAIAAVKRAESLLSGASNSKTSQRTIQNRLTDLNMIAALEKIRLEWRSIVDEEGYFDDKMTDHAYQTAFEQYGLNPDSHDPEKAADHIRSSSVSLRLVTILDHWALE